MTRANIIIYSILQNIKIPLQVNSDAFPKEILPILQTWNGSFKSLSNLAASPGAVGNFSYWYELNVDSGEIKAWDCKIFWVNAPKDWKETGAHCWIGKNGNYGYTSRRKGKVIETLYIKPFPIQYPEETPGEEPLYTSKELKLLYKHPEYQTHIVAQHWRNPALNKAVVALSDDIYEPMYDTSLNDLPLALNRPEWDIVGKNIISWRLKIGK